MVHREVAFHPAVDPPEVRREVVFLAAAFPLVVILAVQTRERARQMVPQAAVLPQVLRETACPEGNPEEPVVTVCRAALRDLGFRVAQEARQARGVMNLPAAVLKAMATYPAARIQDKAVVDPHEVGHLEVLHRDLAAAAQRDQEVEAPRRSSTKHLETSIA